jgi:hypothetical protein
MTDSYALLEAHRLSKLKKLKINDLKIELALGNNFIKL